jgi:hypothetical protein
MTLVDQYEVWWTPRDPEQQDGESTVTLSMPFFKEVRASPIPLRIDTLKVLRGSSQAIDLYLWLTYRNFYSRRESRIPWEALQAQFGAGYLETVRGKRNFKQNFLLALKKVAEVYPEAQKLQAETDVLVYVPGFPDVAPIIPR